MMLAAIIILGGEVAALGYLAFTGIKAPRGYEDPERGFVNLDAAPDYVPDNIMELPDRTWDLEYVCRPLYNQENEGDFE